MRRLTTAPRPIPMTPTCLPDLAEPGEVIRGKTVYGLTGDWDPTRPGDNNVFTQLDSGQTLNVDLTALSRMASLLPHMVAGQQSGVWRRQRLYALQRRADGRGSSRDRQLGRVYCS